MDIWLFDHEEHQRLYNCTAYNVDDVPLEQRQHVSVGYVLIGLALLYEAAYIPVACVLYSKVHLSTCYKLMFYVAVCDILSMLVVGIVTGVFAIQGVVYCSMPEFNHLMGLFASFFWFAESSASVILAVNRCADLITPKVNSLFSGGFWSTASIAAPTAFGLYFIVCTKPCFFNGLFACWMYNPHVGYLTDLSNSVLSKMNQG
ncbi:CRE-SRT-30 protein [Aphelenchoides avenae]|nr:CRE-SRT-30 protein [Aphelenchus avenae]